FAFKQLESSGVTGSVPQLRQPSRRSIEEDLRLSSPQTRDALALNRTLSAEKLFDRQLTVAAVRPMVSLCTALTLEVSSRRDPNSWSWRLQVDNNGDLRQDMAMTAA